jgi:uncharacterized membrane protein
MNKEDLDIKAMIFTGLWIAVVTVVTMAIVIPIPLTQGYVNLGDAAVFVGAYLLRKKNGALAAGLGSALADVLLSYATFAPFTLIIKAGMAFIFAVSIQFSEGRVREDGKKIPRSGIVGIVLATALMAAGYYVAEWILTGNRTAPIVSIPWNILQGLIGGFIALVLIAVLGSLRVPKRFGEVDNEYKRFSEKSADPEAGAQDVHGDTEGQDTAAGYAEGSGAAGDPEGEFTVVLPESLAESIPADLQIGNPDTAPAEQPEQSEQE